MIGLKSEASVFNALFLDAFAAHRGLLPRLDECLIHERRESPGDLGGVR